MIVTLVTGCDHHSLMRIFGLGPSASFHDDFTTKPDGTLAAGARSDSGHPYTVLGQIPWEIAGGRLTHTQTNPAVSQSSYLGVKLDTSVGYIWAEYEVPAGPPHPPEAIVLIISASEFTAPGYEFANAIHCVFAGSAFGCDSIEALHPGLKRDRIVGGKYPALAPGIYHIEVRIDGDRVVVTTPDGKRWQADASNSIAAGSGPWATLQLNNPSSQTPLKELRVLRWGAELQR